MDERELVNFLTSRGAKSECPVCHETEWALIGSDDSTMRLVCENADSTLGKGVEIVVLACQNCAFVRMHSVDAMLEKFEQADH